MKRKLIIFGLLAALVGAVAIIHGCGKSDGNAPGSAMIFGGIS